MTAVEKIEPRMTVEEFYEFDGGGHIGKIELVHGRLRMQSYASSGHATIQGNITSLVGNHLRAKRPGCRVGNEAGVIPTFDQKRNIRKPDVVVTCTPHAKGQRSFPNPILIVEVLSPTNADETWESIQACSNVGSLAEILVVDSETIDVQVFRRDGNGVWPTEPERVPMGGTVRLTSLDLEMPVTEIYRGTETV
jgi:Uma2 family endonuclease